MRREWQPGTLVMVQVNTRNNRWHKAVRVNDANRPWRLLDGHADLDPISEHAVSDAHPLAVIDFEDREQVERLAKEHHAINYIAEWDALHEKTRVAIVDEMQAALRQYASPKSPKPEEPTGLGAVVEAVAYTEEVRPFVRCASELAPWIDDGGNGYEWAQLDAIHVRSEGVKGDVSVDRPLLPNPGIAENSKVRCNCAYCEIMVHPD